jgi:hypothetical protein
MAGKTFERGSKNASFFYLDVSVLPKCPRGDGEPRLGGKSRREERQRPWDGAYGMRRADGGIDERLNEETFYASLLAFRSFLRQNRSHAGARSGWPVAPLERRSAPRPVR